ncbi:MAG: amidohydrolase family protein [Alphaproteobacteria bacterium]|nr:amidohydrolase family protein [Alphaproteobacteria bacterium]
MPVAEPSIAVPPGACDCHMHFYDHRFPKAPTALLYPPEATPADYRAMRDRVGLSRLVVVQPSTYGFDNTCTMEGVAAFPGEARAVVVLRHDEPDSEYRRLTDAGARALRFFMLPGGTFGWDDLEPMAKRIAPFGWHLQLQLDGRLLPEFEARLRRLPCELVVDHNGKFLEPVAPDHPAMASLLRLLDTGRTWVKLSAPYETSKEGPPRYRDVGRIARALARAAPERCVWASNWPHPGIVPRPDDAALVDLLADWAPDERARTRILVDNPAKLYGFD